VVAGSALTFAAMNESLHEMPTPAPKPAKVSAFNMATPKGDFHAAVALVLAKDIEGGYADDKNDRGRQTNFGMSIREVQRLDADKKLGPFMRERFDIDGDGDIDERDVPGWTADLARDFYLKFYWNVIAGDQLPAPIALMLFDSAVNEGTTRAATHLQRSLGGIPVDGVIGPRTIKAAWAWKVAIGDFRPEEKIFLSRVQRYASLSDAKHYFSHWLYRSFKMLKVAQS
jgi:lysozyme family protein